MGEALNRIRSEVSNLLFTRAVANCKEARLTIEDAYKQKQIDPYHAMCLCVQVAHSLCQLHEVKEASTAEIELGNLRMLEHYKIIGRSWTDQEQNANELLKRLDGISEQQADDYIACICEEYQSLPGQYTKMELLLSLQLELALVVVRYRVDTSLSNDVYRRATIAELAYNTELALFETLFYDADSRLWTDIPNNDSPEAIRKTLKGWQRLFDGNIHLKRQTYEDRTDSAGKYQYRQIRPGRVTLLNDRRSTQEYKEYIVPAWVDGKLVTRVEHIPDIKCDVLRFEEGIEDIALTNFHGECQRLVFPDSLVYLRAKSFMGIQSLHQVIMNGAVIEEGAFANCTNLESVYFGRDLWSILTGAFENCVNLRKIRFPNKIYTIGEDAFRNCGIESVTLPEIDTLYDGAFGHCTYLKELRFTGDIKQVYGIPFSECNSIQTVDIDNGVSTLEIIDGALYQVVIDEISEIFLRKGEEAKRNEYHSLLCEISGAH